MSASALRTLAAFLVVAAGLVAQSLGPSTATLPYVTPSAGLPTGAVETTSILTTGEDVNGYRMVGTPDGLGVFSEAGSMTVLMNHEFSRGRGIARAHGSNGSFVSRFEIEPTTLRVIAGRDHNTAPSDVRSYDRAMNAWVPGTFSWDRFCSGDLPEPSAFRFGGLGTDARIYLNGEETRPPFSPRHGPAWAHVATGPEANTSWELPHLGQCAFENVVACPFPQVKTVVVGCDDSSRVTNPMLESQPSELYVYIGDKRANGTEIEKAGLVGGTLYGVRVLLGSAVIGEESNDFGFGTSSYVGSARFELFNMGDASTFDGAAQQTASIANDVTRFQRVEDGSWDARPGFANDFYFVTTASSSRNSRLFRMRFDAIAQPELGGTIEIILDGSEGQVNLDNLCVDPIGRVFLQEDTGGSSRLARVWMYDLVTETLTDIATANPDFFEAGAANFLTTNEESSGIVPAFDTLGEGWYLMDMQNHARSMDPELVEGGQLIAMRVDPNLGRELALWFEAPAGSGSISMNIAYGQASASYLAPVSFDRGNFPNGAFFGIDLPITDLLTQVNLGTPFFGTLNADGAFTSQTFGGLSTGTTFYSVAISELFSVNPVTSAPVSFTIN